MGVVVGGGDDDEGEIEAEGRGEGHSDHSIWLRHCLL